MRKLSLKVKVIIQSEKERRCDGYHSNARSERTEGRRGGGGRVTSCKVRVERELVGGDLLDDDDAELVGGDLLDDDDADGELVGVDLLPLLHDDGCADDDELMGGSLLFLLDDDADNQQLIRTFHHKDLDWIEEFFFRDCNVQRLCLLPVVQ